MRETNIPGEERKPMDPQRARHEAVSGAVLPGPSEARIAQLAGNSPLLCIGRWNGPHHWAPR